MNIIFSFYIKLGDYLIHFPQTSEAFNGGAERITPG
jgi:hypothetical protein